MIAGAVALGFATLASAQTAPAEAAAPVASQGNDRTEAAESPRRARERRRAQEAAAQEAAAPAAPATETAAQPTTEKPADGSGLVCKNIIPAGTRLPQRVCDTQERWDALTEQSQQDMRRFRDRASASGARDR